jgi:hypothetical protein
MFSRRNEKSRKCHFDTSAPRGISGLLLFSDNSGEVP